MNTIRGLLRCGLLLMSTQLLSQVTINETYLANQIFAHQSAATAKTFSLQQTVSKAKIGLVQLSPDGQHLFYIICMSGFWFDINSLGTNIIPCL